MQNTSDVVLICTAEGVITYQSPTAETIWGYAAGDLVGKALLAGVHPDDQPAFEKLLAQFGRNGSTRSIEVRVRDAAGNWRYVELILTNLLDEPDVAGIVATARDIAQRKAFEAQLIQQAFHDALTKLPNRALFVDRLEQARVRSARRQGNVAVLFVDVDNFKLINDSLGHQAGDALLIEAAKRLQACVRNEDTVGRLGGDEFVIVMGSPPTEAVQAAERIEQKFIRPFTINGREFVVTISIGIALGDAVRRQSDVLMRNAEVAMYRRKPRARRATWFSMPACRQDSLVRLKLENDLRQAVRRNELRVHYQPIVILETGRSLPKSRRSSVGSIPREDFGAGGIYLGRRGNRADRPDRRVGAREACRQVVSWRAELPIKPH